MRPASRHTDRCVSRANARADIAVYQRCREVFLVTSRIELPLVARGVCLQLGLARRARVGTRPTILAGIVTAAAVAALAAGFALAPVAEAHAGSAHATFGISITILPADSGALEQPINPFASGTWQAVGGPWHGIMRFDGKTRAAHFAFVGAHPVDASYSYTFAHDAPDGEATGLRGRLHIRRANGLAADAVFVFSKDGKNLTLLPVGSATADHHVRVAPVGEAQAPERLQTKIAVGR